MVLIYAGLAPRSSQGSAERDELAVRSKILLKMHEDGTIVLPTTCAAEIAVPIPMALRAPFMGKLAERFTCHPFDLHAAAIAADLWQHSKKLPRSTHYKDRHLLKADIMVVASAKAAGATQFYSHDQKCRALAKHVMQAHDLPKDDPNDMFLKNDIERGDL